MKKRTIAFFAILSMVLPAVSAAQTSIELQIQQLTAQVEALQAQLAARNSDTDSTTIVGSGCLVLPSLSIGDRGDDVVKLQEFLITKVDWPSGVSATGYFGTITRSAVVDFQVAYNVITSSTSPGAGLVGPLTKAKISEISCEIEAEPEAEDTVSNDDMSQTEDSADLTNDESTTEEETKSPGLYIYSRSVSDSNVVWESGDLGEVARFAFEAVGSDVLLKQIAFNLTNGDPGAIQYLSVRKESEVLGSTNLLDRTRAVRLGTGLLVKEGETIELSVYAKVEAAANVDDGLYAINIDKTNSDNTVAIYPTDGYVVDKYFDDNLSNQFFYLLDYVQDGRITITGPQIPKTVSPGDSVLVTWNSSFLLVPHEKVYFEVLDRGNFTGKTIVPAVLLDDTESYTWTVPGGLTSDTGKIAFKVSCSIHECNSTSIEITLKSN